MLESPTAELAVGALLPGTRPIGLSADTQILIASDTGRLLTIVGPYEGTLDRAAELSTGSEALMPQNIAIGASRGPQDWTLAEVPLRVDTRGISDDLRALLVQEDSTSGLNVHWVEERPDVRLVDDGQKISFVPPDHPEDQPSAGYTLSITSNAILMQAALRHSLRHIARAAGLANLTGEAVSDTVSAMLTITRANDGTQETVKPGSLLSFQHGDQIVLEMENRRAAPVDVTAFYIDAHYELFAIFPQGDSGRIENGEKRSFEATLDSSSSAGIERIVVVGVPGADHPSIDLTPLVDAEYEAAPNSDLQGLAAQFARVGYQRPDLLIDLPEASITVFSWWTNPSQE